jgi:hypothetical protein
VNINQITRRHSPEQIIFHVDLKNQTNILLLGNKLQFFYSPKMQAKSLDK